MRLTVIAGARPNFMKIASIINAVNEAQVKKNNIALRLVHTGQHYDANMSSSFFQDLNIPEPDINLECGGGTQAEQAANIMVKFERELVNHPADLVVVVGDVTSTMACAITAKKLCIDVAHVEGGIRSGDMTMPEEINRIVTDAITDHFFTTSEVANNNLKKSGVPPARIHFVGNTMIDTLLKNAPRFVKPEIWDKINLQQAGYLVLTLHRPSNVDQDEQLINLLQTITKNADGLPVIFPVHPRTAKNLERLNINCAGLHLTKPLSYLQFNFLVKYARGVITDSGGITEETTVLNVPCITLRNSTERPETVTVGTNELIGTDPAAIPAYMSKLLSNNWKKGGIPEKWDGNAGKRIVEVLLSTYA
jgi:UDP-N-acetylglucosamine 2-epimerase (non-hydrolysing)